jgi:hypothetical protein
MWCAMAHVPPGHYESDDPHALADVALASDCIMTLLTERCERSLFAIESRLNSHELKAIDASVMPKELAKIGEIWWARQGSNL